MSEAITGTIVIVGAGHSGGRAALALREQGYSGRLVVIGEEAHPPYERPPLSKQLLLGTADPEHCRLDDARERDIELRLGVPVQELNRERRVVRLADGSEIPYQRLILATGGRVRRLSLPGAELEKVHYLRTLDDATALKQALRDTRHCVVVGGGFIGLEVAAVATQLGCRVTVLEAGERLAARALPAAISERLLALHCRHGVEVRLEAGLQRLEGERNVEAVALEDGTRLACDRVVVGIGIQPNVELAEAAGLATGNGIRVDAHLRTSDRDIYAIGDVCEHQGPQSGQWGRQETWRNAEDQARHVARHLLGEAEPYTALAAFWSDQFDAGLQMIGDARAGTREIIRRLEDNALLLFYLDDAQRLVAASGFGPGNSIAKDIKIAERLIERGKALDPGVLADPAAKLKPLLKA